MTLKEAMKLLTQYTHSLQYKIKNAARDAGKTSHVKDCQSLLANCLVNYFMLKTLMELQASLENQALMEPFAGLMDWMKGKLESHHIKPVNTLTPPSAHLLHHEPYSEYADQCLENIMDFHNLLLSAAIPLVREMIYPNLIFHTHSNNATARTAGTSTLLTPCYLIASIKNIPSLNSHTFSDHLVEKTRNMYQEQLIDKTIPYMLPAASPKTLNDFAILLSEYVRGVKRQIDAHPGEIQAKELNSIYLDFEINYSILLEHFNQDFLSKDSVPEAYLLYGPLMQLIDKVRKSGISRVTDGSEHPPLETSIDHALWQEAQSPLEAIRHFGHQQFMLAQGVGNIARANQYDNLADAADAILEQLEPLLQLSSHSNYNASNYSSISNTRV